MVVPVFDCKAKTDYGCYDFGQYNIHNLHEISGIQCSFVVFGRAFHTSDCARMSGLSLKRSGRHKSAKR